jgi:hypothetical protein
MTLAKASWQPVSLHVVLLGWLRAERSTNTIVADSLAREPALVDLLDRPNINDVNENRTRLRLFYYARWMFFIEIPPDTVRTIRTKFARSLPGRISRSIVRRTNGDRLFFGAMSEAAPSQ